jgi:hypothetical protein
MEYLYTRILSFYLDEEAFEKEVMSWLGVKRNPCKSRMHYIMATKLLRKKYKEAWVGPSSCPEPQNQEASA